MKEVAVHSAPLWRRMGSIFYDALLLAAVLFFATALALPFNAGAAISPENLIFPIYLIAVSYTYFGWFWTHGGQTLGMKVWRVRARCDDGSALGWSQAAVRFAAAIISWLALGLGFVWSLWSPTNATWHDQWSGTKLILVRKA